MAAPNFSTVVINRCAIASLPCDRRATEVRRSCCRSRLDRSEIHRHVRFGPVFRSRGRRSIHVIGNPRRKRFFVDAYSSYILRLWEARTSELRREAAEYALSRAARANRVSVWCRILARLVRRQPSTVELADRVPLRTAAAELRRTL